MMARPHRSPAGAAPPPDGPALDRRAWLLSALALLLALTGAVAALQPSTVQAAGADPTRPPEAVLRQQASASARTGQGPAATRPAAGLLPPPLAPATGRAGPVPAALPSPAGSAAAAASAASAAETTPQLQGVQLSSRNAPTALIDGRLVLTGDQLGAWRVQSIDGEGVTLRHPQRGPLRLNLLQTAAKLPAGSLTVSRGTALRNERPARYSHGEPDPPASAPVSDPTRSAAPPPTDSRSPRSSP
ncbi:MAG: hypothetical protein RL223_710 [Pseudomonadota bacterium]|jgi:hypothetical protein